MVTKEQRKLAAMSTASLQEASQHWTPSQIKLAILKLQNVALKQLASSPKQKETIAKYQMLEQMTRTSDRATN